MAPDRELDDTKISFYLSQPCPAQFPQESTLASSCQTHFHPVLSQNHSAWLFRFGSFFKTRGLSQHPRLEHLRASPWLLLVFQTEERRLVCKQWS